MPEPGPLPERDFHEIYARVPRLTVEIVLADGRGTLLTRRAIDPCRGVWHLPGGTVRFGERLPAALRRVAGKELGIHVIEAENAGVIEYPSHFEAGLDHPVGIAFRVTRHEGELRLGLEASEHGWFRELPRPMHEEQARFLEALGLATQPGGPTPRVTSATQGERGREGGASGGYTLVPIARVESPLHHRAEAPRQGGEGAPPAWLAVAPEFAEGIRDLRPGDQVILLSWLDRAGRQVLSTVPGDHPGGPERGVFSTRSPDRPNPIGLHRVRILSVEGLRIQVDHLEALDGTPIVDLKPVLDAIAER